MTPPNTSERGWTKGEWTVRLVPGSYQRPALIEAEGKLVASCMGNQLEPSATSIREAEANANLIAASPALFEALAGLFEGGFINAGLRGEPDQWKDELSARLEPCRAALARAQGQ